ncbi:MAG: hypothetical protein K9I85_09975 [Saprospiraceae bacterium]|nr:hypothetical protein [Saprospiraceae bacterium]
MDIAASEATAIKIDGDTRNTVDEKGDSIPVCSGNFYRDAVWYSFITPDTISAQGFSIKIYYGESPDDIPSPGIAVYTSCNGNVDNQPLFCANGPENDRIIFSHYCPELTPNETYYIRVWSNDGPASNWTSGWGTFRIAAFVNPVLSNPEIVLWDEGTFNGGLDGWTTEGFTCGKDTSGNTVDGSNALWAWAPYGTTKGGLMYLHQIKSRSACDGAMVFDSEFLDNYGNYKAPGIGPCPVNQEGTLTSPTIDLSGFPVSSVSILFYQKVFNFMSRYFIDYSTDDGQSWNTIEINQDIPLYKYGVTDQIPYDGHDRFQLPGAAGASTLRVRFRMEGNYFYWIVDDVQIIETECSNLRITHDYTVTPNAICQKDQLYDYPAAIQVENIGGCMQSNVVVDLEIKESGGNVVLFESKEIGDVPANAGPGLQRIVDCLDLSEFPIGWYVFTYTVHSNSVDFDMGDNIRSFWFRIDENILAKEASMGFTCGIHPIDPEGSFDYSIGNHFFIPKGDGYEVLSVDVGIANADDLAPEVLGAEAELIGYLYE